MPEAEHELTEAEKQLLIAVSTLVIREQETTKEALDALGQNYFGMYLADWSATYESLVAKGLLELRQGYYEITPEGQPLADKYRAENPKHIYFYNEYFTRAQHSQAHARFCALVYGKDLCQHGMMDMPQLEKLIEILALDEKSRVLELGCGNGLVAQYISDKTLACITGVDTSTVGIQQALQRTSDKRSRLTFIPGDMAKIAFPPDSFDAIIAIDAFYYVGDLDALLGKLRGMVRPGGQMGVFWSSWVGDEDQKESLLPDKNGFAEALRKHGLLYRVWDFTPQEIEHWRRKLEVAAELKQDFEAEGNTFLYERRSIEAKYHKPYIDSGSVSRYLYHVALPKE